MRAPRAKLYLSPWSLYQRPPGATTWQEQTGCHRRTDTLRHGPVIGHETDGDSHSPTSSLHLSLFAVGTSYWLPGPELLTPGAGCQPGALACLKSPVTS